MESRGKVFSEDIELLIGQLVKRVEALESEVAALKGELNPGAVEPSDEPIDLDFSVEPIGEVAEPVAAAAAAVEVTSAAEEEVSVPEAPAPESEPVPETLVPEESEPAVEEFPAAEEPSLDEEEVVLDEELPGAEAVSEPLSEVVEAEAETVSETVAQPEEMDLPQEAPVMEIDSVKEEIPMEDLPADELDDLPFDLPEDDAPFEGDSVPEAAPEAEIPADEPAPAAEPSQEEEPAPVSEEVDLPEEEPQSVETEPSEPEADENALFDIFGEAIEPAAPVKRGRPKKEQKSINETVKAQEAVMDVLYMDSAWRKDIPGPEVRDVRSAITLNDRMLFINRLFRKDSSLYGDSIRKINEMDNLEDVISLIHSTFPEWNMESEDVYKFMMAVRRKIR